jgi:formyltetrahydrofolate hydrolase
MEIEGRDFGLGREEFRPAFAPLAREHRMDWRVAYTDRLKRMGIMVSKYDHCLLDLLWRWDTAEDMVRIGAEVERRVLSRAVQWHIEDRILVDGSRTVVFSGRCSRR